MCSRLVHAIAMACVLSVSALATASESTPLTLGQALEKARALHPRLVGFVFEQRVQARQAQSAALRPATTAELLVEDFGGDGAVSGFDGAQTTLSLSRALELGGKRQGRMAVSDALAARLRSEQAAAQIDLAADIARRFVAMLAQQERVDVSRKALELARSVEAVVDSRVRAAAAPEVELVRASVASAEAELTLEDATHVLATARFELASAMGLAEPDFTAVAGDLYALAAVSPFAELMRKVESAPDFMRFNHEARLHEAELRLAQAQAVADPRLTVGARRFQRGSDTAWLAGLSLPLFSGSRASPAVAASEASRDGLALERQAALLRARALLFARHQEMEHARHVAGVLRDDILGQLGRALEQTEIAYRRGRYSYLEWGDAQKRLIEARERYIAAATEFHLNRIEVERLTGENLTGETP